MKRLLILRHAKSSWKHPDLRDHDRPLNKRGKRDASRMGRLMREEGMLPEWALGSTARRARATLQRALEGAGAGGCEVLLTPELYLADPARIVELLRGTPEPHSRVLVVGHNPGMEELVHALTGEEVTFPTAALAVVDCGCERWAQLALTGAETLVCVWKPRDLGDAGGHR